MNYPLFEMLDGHPNNSTPERHPNGTGGHPDPRVVFTRAYADLRALAAVYLRGQPMDASLHPTALVHEAFVKLAKHAEAGEPDWKNSGHVLAVAARAMRQSLVDWARSRGSRKEALAVLRERERITSAKNASWTPIEGIDVFEIDRALDALHGVNPRAAEAVELRFFAGLSVMELARMQGVSESTAEKEWRWARAWLLQFLSSSQHEPA